MTWSELEKITREFVLHKPPYCLYFPSSNCKTNDQYVGTGGWCIKCSLREALGIEFVEHQPEGRWWE